VSVESLAKIAKPVLAFAFLFLIVQQRVLGNDVHGIWRASRSDFEIETYTCPHTETLLPGRIYLPLNGDTLSDSRNRYQISLLRDMLTISVANCHWLSCFGKSVWI
jgi:hypothetical protein